MSRGKLYCPDFLIQRHFQLITIVRAAPRRDGTSLFVQKVVVGSIGYSVTSVMIWKEGFISRSWWFSHVIQQVVNILVSRPYGAKYTVGVLICLDRLFIWNNLCGP